jgi:hypothetical protein
VTLDITTLSILQNDIISIIQSDIILSVVYDDVIMLSVVAPSNVLCKFAYN